MKRTRAMTVLIGGLVFVGASASLAAFQVQPPPTGVPDVLLERQVTLDRFPSDVQYGELGVTGIDPLSTRKLASDAGGSYWIALDLSGAICIVVGLEGAGDVYAAGCAEPEVFRARGVGIQAYNESTVVEGYLVPDEVFVDLPSGFSRVTENLVVADPTAKRENAGVQASEKFSLALLPAFVSRG